MGRRTTRPSRRAGTLFVVLVSLSSVLSGCLSSGYTYLSHRNPDKTVIYFKLPSSWTRFEYSSDLKSANGALSPSQLTQITGAKWEVTFTSSPDARPSLFTNLGARYPQGVAFAAQLNSQTRDGWSNASLRQEILGTDPLNEGQNSPFNVLSYKEFTAPGGIRGSRLVTDINTSSGLTDTFGQVVEVDPTTNWVFAIGVACRASCWGTNSGFIGQILNTWSVKELVHD
jgi:hypothetical protein